MILCRKEWDFVVEKVPIWVACRRMPRHLLHLHRCDWFLNKVFLCMMHGDSIPSGSESTLNQMESPEPSMNFLLMTSSSCSTLSEEWCCWSVWWCWCGTGVLGNRGGETTLADWSCLLICWAVSRQLREQAREDQNTRVTADSHAQETRKYRHQLCSQKRW